ncbi:MAG: methyl-accepting chemotaxis protein, partial [Planctomycetota bacterium]
ALPITPDELVGTCIDKFHKNPSHQRGLLDDPSRLPLTTQIEVGGETLSFSVSAIYDAEGNHIGSMASGRIMTEEVRTKQKATEVGNSVATSVTEMVATIEEISKNVSRTAQLAQDAEGVATLTSQHVGDLGSSSRKIGEVVGVIQELADQTNLLALNATIEAARAGESGRSFAVVANEVKELANATAKATRNIEQSVREIQDSIGKVVESTDQITAGISEVSTNTTTVAAAIEEQSATMSGLNETASELQSITA